MNYKLTTLFCRSYLLFLITHIIYKASVNPITTDEAYTYLEYVYTNDIFNIGVANNHVLNTFLMSITTLFEIKIFTITNVLSGIAYLITIGYLVKYNYKIYMTLVLTSPIYLIEYFTLARGYGLSSFLIFFGCINYYVIKPYKYNFLISCLLLYCLSSFYTYLYNIFLFSLSW